MSKLSDHVQVDDEKGAITVYGITYTGLLLSDIAIGKKSFQALIDESTNLEPEDTNMVSTIEDAVRMRWLLCGHGPCNQSEQDAARAVIDEAMRGVNYET